MRRCSRSRTSRSTSRPRTASSRPSTASPTPSTAGQALGHRRRVGLGQVGLVADGDGPDARRRNARDHRARSCFDGKDLLDASDEELRTIRGNEIAMIFQDPLSSLHPFYKVGDQLVEARPRPPRRLQGAGARPRGRDARRWSASPSRAGASTPTRTSSPAACASA